MKNRIPIASLLLPLLSLSSCELLTDDPFGPPEPRTYSMDGVHLISPSFSSGQDPRTFLQPEYALSDTERLLVRFESLGAKESSVSLADGRKVKVQIGLVHGVDPDQAEASLVLCPMVHDWMMLATWTAGHPFGASGRWNSPGGDFESSGCVSGVKSDSDGTNILSFDVTQWFVDYVRGRGVNYGQILYAPNGKKIEIMGETNGTFSPRISWLK